MRERCLLRLAARLLRAIEVELQRIGNCHAERRLLCFWRDLLFQLQVAGADLAGPVLLQFIGQALALAERAHAGALDCADMDEGVLAAVFRLDEPETLGVVEKFYGADWHFHIPSMGNPDIGLRELRAADRRREEPQSAKNRQFATGSLSDIGSISK